jgi:hypothetical protein
VIGTNGSRAWLWPLISGGLGLAALVLMLRLVNRLIALPPQVLPDFGGLTRDRRLAAGPGGAGCGVIEEASFRGYMQGPIERRHGITLAI